MLGPVVVLAQRSERSRLFGVDAPRPLLDRFRRAEAGADPVGDLAERDAGAPPLKDDVTRGSTLESQTAGFDSGQPEPYQL